MRRLGSISLCFLALALCSADFALAAPTPVVTLTRPEYVIRFNSIDTTESDTSITVPEHLRDVGAVFLPIYFQDTPAVLAVRMRKKSKPSTLSWIFSNGQTLERDLPSLRKSTLLAYDINGNGTSDLLIIGKRGDVVETRDPLTPSESVRLYTVPMSRGAYVSLTRRDGQPTLVLFDQKKRNNKRRKIRRARMIPLNDPLPLEQFKLHFTIASQPIPLIDENGLISNRFLSVTKRKKKTQFIAFRALGGNVARGSTVSKANLIPGAYQQGTEFPQLLASNDTTTELFSVEESEVQSLAVMTNGSFIGVTSDGGGNGNNNGGGDSGCIPDPPMALLNEIAQKVSQGDYFTAYALSDQIPWLSLCPAAFDETQDLLVNIFSGVFLQSTSVSLLGPPILSPNLYPRLLAGCDEVHSSSDGVNGFVSKASDKDGKFVVLVPPEYSVESAWLVTPSGRKIEKLKDSGRTNGARPTLRGSKPPHAYPRHVVLKTKAQRGYYSESIFHCWDIKNVHSRND